MKELQNNLKLKIYNDSEEMVFCTKHNYWLEIIPDGMDEGYVIKITKKEYEYLLDFKKEVKENE